MGNLKGNPDKKNLRKQAKIIKQRKNAGICRDKKEKAIQEKTTIQLAGINQKRKIKEISTKGKAIQTKLDIQKQRKKILPTT